MNEQNTLPVAYTIFCDDLRQEVGNKVSYMGVYQGMMFVEAFPFVLPKLCAAVTLRVPMDERPKTLVFRMFLDELVIAERSFEKLLTSFNQDSAEPDHNALYMTALFQFTPFAVELPTRLKSRVYYDEQELKAGALNIRLSPRSGDIVTT